MAVNVTARPLALRRALVLPARLVLAGIVGVSFAVRLATSSAHVTALLLPDEYVYRTLAQSISAAGRPLVRGAPAHFPALLEPLLAAPFWLQGDPEVALRLTQGLHALSMSLAAVPVYLLCRRLALDEVAALAAAALAVTSPDLRYTTFVLSDPIAYPLALTAIYAGVRTLERPTRRAQALFAAAAGLAVFARIQYAVLPLALVAAALVLERGRAQTVVRQLRVTLALFLVPVLALAALGWRSVLGAYAGVTAIGVDPGSSLRWLARDTLLLAYSAGWILVPGALVGVALALAQPRLRAERAFAALTVTLALGLLAEAALVAQFDSKRFEERYLLALLPLVAPAFALGMARGRRARGSSAVIALLLLVGAARIPLSGFSAAHGYADSATLAAVRLLEQTVGTANGALVVAALAGLLSLAACGVALRPTAARTLGFALALVATTALSVSVYVFDAANSRAVRAAYLPADARWVDHAGLGGVALLETPGSDAGRALDQLFWNRSVDDVLLLGRHVRPVDNFGATRVRVAGDGSLVRGGETVRRPLLVQTVGSTVRLRGATRVARGPGFELWRPAGRPRLALLAAGRYDDGWLAASGAISVWPDRKRAIPRVLRLVISLPGDAPRSRIVFRAPGLVRRVALDPGTRRTVDFRLTGPGPWTLVYHTPKPRLAPDLRLLGVRAPVVRLVAASSIAATLPIGRV